jgi:hypothetical protein
MAAADRAEGGQVEWVLGGVLENMVSNFAYLLAFN